MGCLIVLSFRAQHLHHALLISPFVLAVLLLAQIVLLQSVIEIADPQVEVTGQEMAIGISLWIGGQPRQRCGHFRLAVGHVGSATP